MGKKVVVTSISKKINGRAIGIDSDCNLLLELANKKIIKINEGDVTIRY